MDITKKIKSFVARQGSRSPCSPVEPVVSRNFVTEAAVVKEKDDYRESTINPQAEAEILQSIEGVYFNDDTFDACDYQLKKIPAELDLNQIIKDKEYLQKQQYVVSKKVSDLILQNQAAYTQELHRVTELQKNLEQAGVICSQGRSHLARARKDFTTASLGILASFRKRERLLGLLKFLHSIKTMQETDVRLRELLEEEDYPGAIQLCLECQKAAIQFRHYKCISELSSKLQDTLEMMEEKLDVALSKVCTNFNTTHYEKLQAAYRLLGKTQTAMDQLLMHFASAIHNKAFTLVLGYVELCAGGSVTKFQKHHYSELAKMISVETFTPCLKDLCKALWEVMHSYWCIVEWHEDHDSQPSQVNSSTEVNLTHHYVRQKLEHGLLRIWQDVQQKVKTYILASDLSSFKFDEFIHILDLVRRLIDIGEEFCNSKSEDLQESLRKQSVNYFRNYHRGCMEELRMFLENESWALCPVRPNFSILQLQEFRFLRHNQSRSVLTPPSSPAHSKTESTSFSGRPREGYFRGYRYQGNPFEEKTEEEDKEDVLAPTEEGDGQPLSDTDSEDEDIADELKKEYVDENTGDTPNNRQQRTTRKTSTSSRRRQILILTNTTLNVLRLFGKYMQMMNLLKPIAFDVLICMSQLFDYYMFSVYTFFSREIDFSENALSNKLRTTLKRIRENLILAESESDFGTDMRNKDKVPAPVLSTMVDLKSIEQLYGLAERVTAAESLVFLANQFEFLHPHLETFIPSSKKAFLQQFCSQTILTAPELRRPIYMTVAARGVDYNQVLMLMNCVKWDVHDIMSQHSYYVDILLRELQVFSMRLLEVNKKTPIPKEASDILWEHCIRLANRTFIEGFSQAKKCTNEGRALMQLDYQQFLTKVEGLTDLRLVPERELVEGYIKAFYLLEPALEQWIRSHREYTQKQLIGLVSCVTQLNKKGRQKLISLIEEGDKIRR
ncbi:vacuolar protein sorting 50 isoform X1 [Tachypleus tridentatus]|uniref:vacuolar protein sorting 50 isoform X1 n=2 Tax=Tachypleus tridentatus TaxID=6853 RepID=UPI003FD04CBB